MTEMTNNDPADNDEDFLKKRLFKRIAVAGVLILLLLGSLALFDSLVALNTPSQKLASNTALPAPPPLPVTQPKEEEKPAKGAEAIPESTEGANTEALQGAPAKERPLTKPATAQSAILHPGALSSSAPLVREPQQDVEREVARVARPPVARHAPASRPLTQMAAANRHFVVQMGVFSNIANAEELRAKLELNGIPAQIEARVKVGPFKSRKEAVAAQKKMAALGLDTGMLISSKK